ncbi:MAG: TetR/AcrR family transcriptional regulator [Pseudomonadota bacterium]
MALKDRGTETRAERSRADILTAAAERFKESGFAGTSIDDVARSLGATKGMVYHHFPSKTDLFFAVYQRAMDINFEAVSAAARHNKGPVEHLAAMAHAHAVTMMRAQAFQRTISQGVVMHQTGATTLAQRETLEELIKVRDRYETLFSSAIAAATAAGDVLLDDLSVATKTFLAVLNSTVHWYSPRAADAAVEQDELARQQVAFAMRGLGLTSPNESKDRP